MGRVVPALMSHIVHSHLAVSCTRDLPEGLIPRVKDLWHFSLSRL